MASTRVRVEDGTSLGRSYQGTQQLKLSAEEAAARRSARTHFLRLADDKLTFSSLTSLSTHLSRATNEDLLRYFHNTWDITETLFSALKDDSVIYSIPDVLRRPLIFYYGHTAAVYANKLVLAGLMENVNLYLQKLFETGVDEMSWDDVDVMQREDFVWPTVQETIEFREAVKRAVEKLIREMPSPREHPVTMDSPYWAVVMGFEHERIHIETSSVLFRQLPVADVVCPPGWRYGPRKAAAPEAAPANELLLVEGGLAVLGKPRDFPSFGWDNEYGKRSVVVKSFRGSKFMVTNAEFLPFVLDGGYQERQWWVAEDGDDEGWRWVQYRNATHPSFWVATQDMPDFKGGSASRPYQKDDCCEAAGCGDQFRLRVMFDIIDMPWSWPVVANFLEAKAFCRWKAARDGLPAGGYRLPTEAEYQLMRAEPTPFAEAACNQRAREAARGGGGRRAEAAVPEREDRKQADEDADASGAECPEAAVDVIMRREAPGNLNFRFGSSTPVDLFPANAAGFYDMHGNAWEWAEDHFAPLPGFAIHYLYDDFSAPCFDGWHSNILGGSWVSTGDQASSFARYSFRRHFFQHAGFRYVAPDRPEQWPGCDSALNLWEGIGDVSRAITNGYAPPVEKLPPTPAVIDPAAAADYPAQVSRRLLDVWNEHCAEQAASTCKVLHLGCSAGGVTMALTQHFGAVTGVEQEEPLLRQARVLQHHAQLEHQRIEEGILTRTELVQVPTGAHRRRAQFILSPLCPACKEVKAAGPFDLVFIDGQLDCRPEPLALLRSAAGLVRAGGLLVTATSNDWSTDATPRTRWLGGFKMNGEPMGTSDMLQAQLRGFGLVHSSDLARLTRQHARRFVIDLMQVAAFKLHSAAPATAAGEG